MARVAVIGGGLSGLVSALTLLRARHSVCVLEAAEAYGGQIQTEHSHGYVVEHGAEGWVARSEALSELAERMGIADSLIGQLTMRGLGLRGGTLRELAPGEAGQLLGFQVPRDDLGGGVRTCRRGTGELIEALRRTLAAQVELRSSFAVDSITRQPRGYRLRNADGVQIEAERLVIATSARNAARLLTPVCGPAAAPLKNARVLSNVSVTLAYAREQVTHALDATGFVVATEEQQQGLRACTFVSSKFESRAPAGKVSLRAFFRPLDTEIHVLADATYAARARSYLAEVLGIAGEPEHVWVARWPDALPVFEPAHTEAVAQLSTALSGSGIALAGSAFHGSGIDAAVRSATSVGDRL
ncbi:MAG TPA: FAD-dependent oxidoreductase [Polyangiales bacterium]|nr:FAD-dependent oxidoreductase [Polyangiales bacterium]